MKSSVFGCLGFALINAFFFTDPATAEGDASASSIISMWETEHPDDFFETQAGMESCLTVSAGAKVVTSIITVEEADREELDYMSALAGLNIEFWTAKYLSTGVTEREVRKRIEAFVTQLENEFQTLDTTRIFFAVDKHLHACENQRLWERHGLY